MLIGNILLATIRLSVEKLQVAYVCQGEGPAKTALEHLEKRKKRKGVDDQEDRLKLFLKIVCYFCILNKTDQLTSPQETAL